MFQSASASLRSDNSRSFSLLPRLASLHAQALFLWVKSHSAVFSLLCVNVQSEICTYFARCPVLAYAGECGLITFNIRMKTGTQVISATDLIPVHCSSVAIDDNGVFLSGGRMRNALQLAAASSYFWNGTVMETLSDMQVPRCGHTLFFSESELAVFAFGSNDRFSPFAASCEMYSLSQNRWEEVPRMKHGRTCAGATQRGKSLFVGGGHPSIEVFDLNSWEWTAMYSVGNVCCPHFRLAFNRNSLVVMSRRGCSRMNLENETMETAPALDFYFLSSVDVVVEGNLAFTISAMKQCVCIDLDLLARRPEIEMDIRQM